MAENKNNMAMAQEGLAEESFIKKNLKTLCIGAAFVALVLVGIWGANLYFNANNQKAAEALAPCEQLFQEGQYEKALNGDGAEIEGLLAVADKYGRTKSGNLAKLYAGLAYAQLENYEEAEKFLSDFDAKGDEMISPAAIAALANVQVQLNNNDKAVELFQKAAKKANNVVLSPLFLVQAAEILEADGKTEEALKLYEEVKNNYGASQQAQEIDKYIERAKAAK